jgi:hypothetical protein
MSRVLRSRLLQGGFEQAPEPANGYGDEIR